MAAARTKPLYEALKKTLPERFPNLKIAFVGCPFAPSGKRKYPLPLLWGPEERAMHPTSRLLKRWARMNEHADKVLASALAGNDIVVTLLFGYDAVRDSTSRCDDTRKEIDEAERIHHALVKIRIKEQGIKPPLYFIPTADARDTHNLVQAFPTLRGTDPRMLEEFMRHEQSVSKRYFTEETGQRKYDLPLSLSIEEMCKKVIEVIEADLQQRKAA